MQLHIDITHTNHTSTDDAIGHALSKDREAKPFMYNLAYGKALG